MNLDWNIEINLDQIMELHDCCMLEDMFEGYLAGIEID